MMARWLAFGVWAAAAASAVFWGLKLFAQPSPPPAHAVVVAATAPAAGADLTRMFGVEAPPPPVPVAAAPAAPPPSTRFQLIGVVAARNRPNSEGVALIAVDGKAPRAYRVGARIEGDQVLQSVQPRSVAIGPRGGAAVVALELPALPPAATGVLPPAGANDGAAPGAAGQVPLQMLQPGQVPVQTLPPAQPVQPAPPGFLPPGAAPGTMPQLHPRFVPGAFPPGARSAPFQVPAPVTPPNEANPGQ